MSRTLTLQSLARRQIEISTSFRHLATRTQGLFEEASWSWRDRRGQSFALSFMTPQVDAMEVVSRLLQEQSEALETTRVDVSAAEAAATRSLQASEVSDHLQEKAQRLADQARERIGIAITDAGRARDRCGQIRADLAALGAPPI